MTDYPALVTVIGQAKLTNAFLTGGNVNLTELAVGNGDNDTAYTPSDTQTALKGEVYRAPINEITTVAANQLKINGVIPVNEGGWTVREVGIFDDAGNLIMVGKYPESYKPVGEQGNLKDFDINMILQSENASVVNLIIDPTAVIATRKYVDDTVAANIGGEIADINGLQAALDGKAAVGHNHDSTYRKLSDYVGHGQCRLSLDGTDLKLSPLNGNKLIIDGLERAIPSAGVALAPTGLVADTTYFIYAFMSGDPAAITLEASATGHTADANGVEIKTGDGSRTLVGMARTIAGPSWVDSGKQLFVISWFNSGQRNATAALTSDVNTGATVFTELEAAQRVEFLSWESELIDTNHMSSATSTYQSTAGAFGVSVDGASPTSIGSHYAPPSQYIENSSVSSHVKLTEGFHYATMVGRVQSGYSLTFRFSHAGNSTACNMSLKISK